MAQSLLPGETTEVVTTGLVITAAFMAQFLLRGNYSAFRVGIEALAGFMSGELFRLKPRLRTAG